MQLQYDLMGGTDITVGGAEECRIVKNIYN